ncbi:3-hydroxyacyl-ACP dehydratase FabZ family protein [Tuwongella immobilis]|uniref:Beta-hydroxyacyl-ACP dehydratase n=1 Tax=Tuwongella immobilis TaxID=692036 RepID=A0A6C2YGR0_9BACT|nr:3-hydroxyacyl-ACP dehydratase FabZ family protein [Tuwongella immobilis]VIP00597.1 3-hydroxymyristoyl/3-hydroxydecanoyl-(Acyl carrier protein) dehydratase OS=Singulisphaera acidiphila (strain ATCC BAA-1392 / DSM 18658 / VKM B-2454 / MOB10) GN=Sinac_6211 PE=4 SV=1: FabA [Tuwongella immobilis]VTR96612.1 3-hydroxymyristoyl/3-hydroxydecanoyl-(Acyl carrier protein) dehydratase OS=Singulisphaera acidiphila (strain ATCC BAA-1392 / DSM 18658 / VKM B-2454 / MOB10) GN=Sinac_6211 PE=4 SV=1: FabA [Tuwonge
MRWIWIDRFVAFESGRSARAVKALSHAEDLFADHFPGYPIMPAPLMLEGLAQTGGILVGEARDFREKVVLAKVPTAKFHREVFPGRLLTYDAEILTLREEGAAVLGKIWLDSELIVEAEIFFAHLDQSRSQQLFGDQNFVFSGELKNLLGLARKVSSHPSS